MRRLLGLAASCCLLWAAYLRLSWAGFLGDPFWYLEPARNFASGQGLVTRMLYPAQVAHYPAGFTLPVPPLHHGPLSLLLIGAGYKLFGFSDWVPLAYAFSMTLITGLLAYRLGRRLGGERAGLSTAALFWTSFMVIEGNTSALTDPLFIVLVTASASLLWGSREAPKPERWLAAAGLALGLASCTRLAGQAYWLGFAAAAFWLHRSWRRLGVFLGGLALPLAGLAAYNYSIAGFFFYSPGFYLLVWCKTFPGFRSSTSYLDLTSGQALLAYPRDIAQKCLTGPLYAALRFLEASSAPWVSAVLAFGLAGRPADRQAADFRVFALIIAIPMVLLNIMMSYGAVHYLQPVFPLLLAAASAWLWRFLDEQAPWLKHPAIGLPVFALLFLSPLALASKDGWKARAHRLQVISDQAALGRFVAERTAPEDVVYTDDPQLVAWHARRGAISLGATMEDARKTLAHLPARAILLSSERIESEDYDEAWRRAFAERKAIMGFEPCADFKSETLTALLLRLPGDCRRTGYEATGGLSASRRPPLPSGPGVRKAPKSPRGS